jgi:hypothetical protein
MHTQSSDGQAGVGNAAKEVAEHASALARLELELAGLEVKRKLGALGAGAGLAIAGAVFAVYGLGFLFATVSAAFDTFLPEWLGHLLTALLLFALAGLLVLVGVRMLRRGTPPVPEQAIREAKLTTEAIKR